MRPVRVKPLQVPTDVRARRAHTVIGLEVTVLTLRHKRSMKTLSRYALRPSIESLQPPSSTALVNSSAVNWLP